MRKEVILALYVTGAGFIMLGALAQVIIDFLAGEVVWGFVRAVAWVIACDAVRVGWKWLRRLEKVL